MNTTSTGRAQRTDAQRNRQHILDVAERSFSEEGIELSMDAIAKRSGVGAGTLYRHFPTREALVAAVLDEQRPDLERERVAAEQEADSLRALEHWLSAVSDWMHAYQGLAEPLRAAAAQRVSPLTPTCDSVIATTDQLLKAAQADGHARPDVRGRDLFLGTLAAVWASDTESADERVGCGLRELLRTGWATKQP